MDDEYSNLLLGIMIPFFKEKGYGLDEPTPRQYYENNKKLAIDEIEMIVQEGENETIYDLKGIVQYIKDNNLIPTE